MYTLASSGLETARVAHSFLEHWALGFFLGVVACDTVLHFMDDSTKLVWSLSWPSHIVNLLKLRVTIPAYRDTISVKRLIKKLSLLGFGVAITLEIWALPYSDQIDTLSDEDLRLEERQTIGALRIASAGNVRAGIADQKAGAANERASKNEREAARLRKDEAILKGENLTLEASIEQLRKDNLELEKEFSPRLFRFQNAAAGRLRQFSGIAPVILTYLIDSETRRTAEQIAFVLWQAKIQYTPMPNRDGEFVRNGVVIEVSRQYPDSTQKAETSEQILTRGQEWRTWMQATEKSRPFAKALVNELNGTDISTREGLSSFLPGFIDSKGVSHAPTVAGIVPGTIIVEVGMKPSPAETKRPMAQDNSGNSFGLPR